MEFEKTRSAGYLANHMARLFANRLAAEIDVLGLAPAQFMTLLELWERDGLTQAELIDRLDVEQATLANTLSRMDRDGLIKRTPHPNDKRAKLIWLTQKSRDLEVDAKASAAKINHQALKGLNEAEIGLFLKLAQRVVTSLRHHE